MISHGQCLRSYGQDCTASVAPCDRVAATDLEKECELYPKIKGLQPKTVEAYARAIRRAGNCFDHQIDGPIEVDLVDRFTDLRETHSRSSVKLDLYGLKFHYEHVLRKPWAPPGLIKLPRAQRLPDIIPLRRQATDADPLPVGNPLPRATRCQDSWPRGLLLRG